MVAVAALCACGPQKAPSTAANTVTTPQNAPAAPASNAAAMGDSTPGKMSRAQLDAAYTPGFNKCMDTGDAKEGVTSAMLDCLSAEGDRQEARLNAAYKSLLERSDPAARERIRTEERAWIRQRKARCEAPLSESSEGTGGSLDRWGCYIDTAIEQTAALAAR
jgi:uncharacterized protein YecT (DUF1311 family)